MIFKKISLTQWIARFPSIRFKQKNTLCSVNAIFHACKNDSSNYNHFIKSVNTCIEQPELKFTSEHVFHSFRHTVRTEFRRNRAPEDDVCRICGWEDGSKGKTLADHYGESVLENLQETVNSGLKYDGVQLEHLYV